MSTITDAAILVNYEDDRGLKRLNDELKKRTGDEQEFTKMDNSAAGGRKSASMTVYQACFNHVADEDIIESYRMVLWRSKETLLVLDSESGGWSVHQGTHVLARSW